MTNQKSVRLNHGARTKENVSVSYYFAYQMEVQGKAALRLGYDSLKAEQELAITSFIRGNDVFVSLPTGYSKSLCFALLPSVFDMLKGVEKASIVLVISVNGIKHGEYQVALVSYIFQLLVCTGISS